MRALCIALVLCVSVRVARAESVRLAVGGQAGAAYNVVFPAYYLGANGDVDVPLGAHVAATAEVRLLGYLHPEDENFGSDGFQLDGTVGIRATVRHAFVAARIGGRWLHDLYVQL